MEKTSLMLFKVRVHIAKSKIIYTGFLSNGFHTITKEIIVEAESPLSAKLIVENQYGPNSCATFPRKVDE